jgi:hypothetical protein
VSQGVATQMIALVAAATINAATISFFIARELSWPTFPHNSTSSAQADPTR